MLLSARAKHATAHAQKIFFISQRESRISDPCRVFLLYADQTENKYFVVLKCNLIHISWGVDWSPHDPRESSSKRVLLKCIYVFLAFTLQPAPGNTREKRNKDSKGSKPNIRRSIHLINLLYKNRFPFFFSFLMLICFVLNH